MSKLANISLIVGIVSIILGIISRVLLVKFPPSGLEAQAFLAFAQTCFLLAIAIALVKK